MKLYYKCSTVVVNELHKKFVTPIYNLVIYRTHPSRISHPPCRSSPGTSQAAYILDNKLGLRTVWLGDHV